jgi:hypothetical protein
MLAPLRLLLNLPWKIKNFHNITKYLWYFKIAPHPRHQQPPHKEVYLHLYKKHMKVPVSFDFDVNAEGFL